ncbi:MAG: glycosyltransferase family 2 protein [Ignavibacteria bacterium]|nr:glycosyltransferase family 2 protein [Ignavibacteria bacterium]
MSPNLVTVLMPLKNGLPFLEESVNSILQQSFREFEFIIVDDHSTDNSLEFLENIKDPRIKILKNKGYGIAEALNTGIDYTSTKYLAIMDADDISDNNRIKNQFNYLECNNDCVIVGTSIFYFTSSSYKRRWKVRMPSSSDVIKYGLNNGLYVLSHPTIMVRTSSIIKIGGYKSESFPNIDVDFYKRLIQEGYFSNLSEQFTSVRLHVKSFTQNYLPAIVKNNILLKRNKKTLNTIYDKLVYLLKYLSTFTYKKSVILYLNGSYVLWIFYLLAAGLFDIPKTLFFIRNKLVR